MGGEELDRREHLHEEQVCGTRAHRARPRGAGQAGEPVRLGEIAERRDMPLQFLEQVFAALRRGEIVRSRRGAAGGYALARSADEITVLDVVAVLDGVPSPAECTQGRCVAVESCGASSVWIEAQRALEDVLTATTIGDLLRREDQLRETAPMYHV